jgi:gamma-glutamylcyclotransferase (GGCT)/AIG2-like uncharacterized protein YtfP
MNSPTEDSLVDTSRADSLAQTKAPPYGQALEASSFKPHLMFFYGTLCLPHILKHILHLPSIPIMKPARIRGYRTKMWGPYPALLKAEGATANDTLIYGMVYKITEEQDLQRLKQYEGENYKLVPCPVQMQGESPVGGWTFVWNGYPGELKEGSFELGSFAM